MILVVAELLSLDDATIEEWRADRAAALAHYEDARWGFHLPEPPALAQLPGVERFAVVRQGVEVGRIALRQSDGAGWLALEDLWVNPAQRGRRQMYQLVLVAEAEVRRRHLDLLFVPTVPISVPGAVSTARRCRFDELVSTRRVDLATALPGRRAPLRRVEDVTHDLPGFTLHPLLVEMSDMTVHVDARRRIAAVGLQVLAGLSYGVAYVVATASRAPDGLPEVVASVADVARGAGMTHLDVVVMSAQRAVLPMATYPVREVSLIKRP